MPARTIVVGGGIAGSSLAYLLTRAGVDVTIVDAGLEGTASMAGAGIMGAPLIDAEGTGSFRPPARAPALDRLDLDSAAFYPRLAKWLAEDGQEDIGCHTVGTLWVHSDADEAEAFVGRAADLGLEPGEPLGGAALRARLPLLAEDAIAVPTVFGARIDGRRVRNALIAAARRRGAQVIEGRATAGEAPGAIEVQGDDGVTRLEAEAVCLATGAWPLRPDEAATHPAIPQRGQVLRGDITADQVAVAGPAENWPVLVFPGHFYLCGFGPREVLVGTTRDSGVWDTSPSSRDSEYILAGLAPFTTGLEEIDWTPTVGLRPESTSGEPVAGPSTRPREWVLNGFGGGGLTQAPYLAFNLANQMVAALGAAEVTV